MAEILIKNMEMPKQMESPITITIFQNGSVWMNDVTFGKGKLPNAKAIELPPHGELCDKYKLKEATKNTEIRNSRGEIYPIGKAIAKMIDEAPTVLEATC